MLKLRRFILPILISIVFLAILGLGILSFLSSHSRPKLEGQWLAFGCGGRIYLMREDGSGQHSLLPSQYQHLSFPTWSPDGKRIAYAQKYNPDLVYDNGIIIHSAKTDGSDVQQITGTLQSESWEPNWSPDGQWILFVADVFGKPGWDLYRVHPDGTQRQQLTHAELTYEANPEEPDWSPTGEQIAFRQGNSVYIMNADGNDSRMLVDAGTSFASPTWSPDGEWIAFVQNTPGEQFTLSRIRVDGSEIAEIVSFRLIYTPEWSPGGEWIVFTAITELNSPEGFQLWKVHPDGTGLEQITHMNGCTPSSAAWSPWLE